MPSSRSDHPSDISFVESLLQRISSGSFLTEEDRADLNEALQVAEHHVEHVARDKQRWRVLRGRLRLAQISDVDDTLSLVESADLARRAVADLVQDPTRLHYLQGQLTLGRLLMMRGLMDEALQHFVTARPLAEELGDSGPLGVLEGNIATITFQMRHYSDALEWFWKAVRTFEQEGNQKSRAFALRGVGMCYSKLGEYQKALDIYSEAQELIQSVPDGEKEYISILESTGIDYLNLRDETGKQVYYQRAISAFEECRGLALDKGMSVAHAVSLRNLAMTYAEPDFADRDLGRSRSLYQEALTLVRDAGAQLLESQILRDLSNVFEELGDLQQALTTYRTYYDLERALLNQETESQIKALELKLATEKQEEEARSEFQRAEELRTELETERHLVTSTSLSIGEKNAALREAQLELKKIMEASPPAVYGPLRRVVKMLESAEDADQYWQGLEQQLQHVHKESLDNLSRAFPGLTATERRVCAMILHELSTKDIARLLAIEARSVEKYRQRIRKKLGLKAGENLQSFLASR